MKVFDYLHQELCMTMGKPVPRYGIWTSMALQDAHPAFDLTPEKAANYLENGTGKILDQCRKTAGEKKWAKLVARVRKFNPDQDTPEEVFTRLCKGLTD